MAPKGIAVISQFLVFQARFNLIWIHPCKFFFFSVSFVRKVIWLYPATCFVIWGCHESSSLASWTRTKCVSMIYRNDCDSASMHRQLHIWQCICTNAFLQEAEMILNASIITWLLLNVWIKAVFDYFGPSFWQMLTWTFLAWQLQEINKYKKASLSSD